MCDTKCLRQSLYYAVFSVCYGYEIWSAKAVDIIRVGTNLLLVRQIPSPSRSIMNRDSQGLNQWGQGLTLKGEGQRQPLKPRPSPDLTTEAKALPPLAAKWEKFDRRVIILCIRHMQFVFLGQNMAPMCHVTTLRRGIWVSKLTTLLNIQFRANINKS